MAKVLIVEDEPDVLKVIKARIESQHHDVITALDGVQALQILKTELPDLIISDVLMPEMDGFQLYKELKQNPLLVKIPVLVVTARGKMEDTFRVIGVDDFISKPFDTEDFLKKVAALLAQKAVSPEEPAAPRPAPQQSPPSPVQNTHPTGKGLRVLVAGEDKAVVNKMAQLFNKAGMNTEFALTVTDIISKRNAFQPSLILLDILYEDAPADEIVGMLRQPAGLNKTSIVLYSVASDKSGEHIQQRIITIDTLKENCLAAGATEYLGSFNERTFMTAVSRYLK